jgi:hypothetical protein
MKNYRVLLNGENFLLDLGEGLRRHGFYTTCLVSASNEEEAELNAVESIRKRGNIKQLLKNEPNDPPMYFAEEIEELGCVEERAQEHGFSWYIDNSE